MATADLSSTSSSTSSDVHVMQCLEVWGGNQRVDSGVEMAAGLDAWVFSEPYQGDAGGGDVHYVSSCATGRIVRLLVADIAGHGAGVADIASGLRRLMRRYVNHVDQSRFLKAINREYPTISSAGRFATATAATFWGPTSDLIICNAGHPAPLWYQARRSCWRYLDQDLPGSGGGELANAPLGLLDLTRYDQWKVRLAKDDLVLFYTDSMIEATRADGRQLGLDGFLSLVRTLDAARPHEFVNSLIAQMQRFKGGRAWEDDVTLLLVKPNGRNPRMTLRERFQSNVRMAGALLRSMKPGGEPMPWPELSYYNIFGALVPGVNERFGKHEGRMGDDAPEPRAD